MKNPQVINALHSLAAKSGGVLLPEDVVAAASDEASPLHSHFTWDDTEAAHAYRLAEARTLIRVVVHTLPGRENEEPTSVFVSLTPDRKTGGYRAMVDVLSDAEARAQLLADAAKEMESFRKKYGHLKELAAVFEAMASVHGEAASA